MPLRRESPTVPLFFLLLAAAIATLGQTTAPAPTGSLIGRVLDKQGQVAINARVRAQDPASVGTTLGFSTDRSRSGGQDAGATEGGGAITDDRGAFTLDNLPPGKINLIVTLTLPDGTRQRGQASIEVHAGKQIRLPEDIRLADAPAPAATPSGSALPNPNDRIRTSRGTRGINP